MTDLDRRTILRNLVAGAFVAAAGVSLAVTDAEAAPMMGVIPDDAMPNLPVEDTAVRCWWRGGQRVCARRPVRRVCWWRRGRRVCAWR
jgi:hypothetical protein